jgi:hypothetical protein
MGDVETISETEIASSTKKITQNLADDQSAILVAAFEIVLLLWQEATS